MLQAVGRLNLPISPQVGSSGRVGHAESSHIKSVTPNSPSLPAWHLIVTCVSSKRTS